MANQAQHKSEAGASRKPRSGTSTESIRDTPKRREILATKLCSLQREIRREIDDDELDILIDRLIPYSDQQLDDCFRAIATTWDQGDAKHFHFPNTADFLKHMPTATTDRISQYATPECKDCKGTGWRYIPSVDPQRLPRTVRCECFQKRVKQIEAAKQPSQKLLQASPEEQPSLPMVADLAKQKRL